MQTPSDEEAAMSVHKIRVPWEQFLANASQSREQPKWKSAKDRYDLLQRGFFPETLPPCYSSQDLKRSLVGLVKVLNEREFHKRPTDYIRYNGTKHDGSRRYFGSPNPISYFYVASFIAEHWETFDVRYSKSPFSVSQPRIGKSTDDRAIIIPSLSELTTEASKKISHSAYVLKTDIAQFFPSIYTHAIAWSAHGIDAAKADPDPRSKTNLFNRLDYFVRNCQRAETRGVLVGPDAFRLITEFIAAGLDEELNAKVATHIVGAARHVDDYYFGLTGEMDGLVVLSALRDTLQRYNLNVNDAKTRIMLSVEPLNELWAQELRADSRVLRRNYRPDIEDVVLFITKALDLAVKLKSDSPVKIALRTLDQIKSYSSVAWDAVEPYLQRIMIHHPHCIDYVALLVVKRVALGSQIDRDGWKSNSYNLLRRHLALNHHHEIVWLVWLLISVKIEMAEELVAELSNNDNAHIRALVVAAHVSGQISKKPPIRLGSSLATTDNNWLLNLVSRADGYTGAKFSGPLSDEFDHLAKKKIKLIDFKAHIAAARKEKAQAISRTRYGYDDDEDPEDDDIDF